MSTTSLASVVSIPERINMWQKLKDSEPLVKLHAKFWGKGMLQEEASGQSRLTSEDDTKNGYVLVLGNDAFDIESIWAEYIRIYDFLLNHYNKKRLGEKLRGESRHRLWSPDNQALASPILPSFDLPLTFYIGKSVWIYYALCRCLSEKRPVIWRYDSTPYMVVWTLVDSDESNSGVPGNLVQRNRRFFVIYATSPAKGRWSRMPKTTSCIVVVMNPWSRGEIHRAAALLEDIDRPSTDIINDTFDRFGPIPSICLETASSPYTLGVYETEVNGALNRVTVSLQSLLELMTNVNDLTMDAVSHKLCLVKREEINNIASKFLISPITKYIQSRLANCRIVPIILFLPFFESVGRHYFENICHMRFQKHISIWFVSMVRSDKKRNLKWHSSHCAIEPPVLQANELEKQRQVAFRGWGTLDVCPSIFEYDHLAFALEQGVYYIPKKPNEVAFDSFIFHDSYLYIFQFTVSKEHGINDKLISRFEECTNVPPHDKWRFIFVIPDDVKALECPYPKSDGLQRLKPLSSQISLEDFAYSVSRDLSQVSVRILQIM
ncbi:hypothetical protein BJV77DRAFT_1066973 [Russula vinacea]|nr:hypothetical protein BJV77DRAFT_1066973 [Russula vinacea]